MGFVTASPVMEPDLTETAINAVTLGMDIMQANGDTVDVTRLVAVQDAVQARYTITPLAGTPFTCGVGTEIMIAGIYNRVEDLKVGLLLGPVGTSPENPIMSIDLAYVTPGTLYKLGTSGDGSYKVEEFVVRTRT